MQGDSRAMNLVVDIGNSRMKAAVFEGGVPVGQWVSDGCGFEALSAVFDDYPQIDRCIVSSTRKDDMELERSLAERAGYFLKFENTVPVPLSNLYATPHTLGCDRLAAAVGAMDLFPGRNLLIVDFGSAITADVVTAAGEYLGGSISPGLDMRLRALADYTGKLPRLGSDGCPFYAHGDVPATTRDAMLSGVVVGIELEVLGRMAAYGEKYDGLVTIFTGGDAAFFEKRFKNTIFANRELVLTGLNTILDYNADKGHNL